MPSYLTEPEWHAAFAHFGMGDALAYAEVTHTQLSVARHFGGATVNGATYYYIAQTDELVRADVFKWVHRVRADACRAQAAAARDAQAPLI